MDPLEQKIRTLKQSGKTYAEIGKMTGLSVAQVRNVIKIDHAQRASENCEACGKPSDHLQYHHVDYATNDNFEILCPRCHRKRHIKPIEDKPLTPIPIIYLTKKGRPRLSEGEARSEILRIRLTPDEKAAILAQAENCSEWVRNRLLEGLMQPC